MSLHVLHKLKIKQEYAIQYYAGVKDWELRFNDRDFKTGDYIEFTIIETGAIYIRQIINVFSEKGFGLKKGYVILSIEKSE